MDSGFVMDIYYYTFIQLLPWKVWEDFRPPVSREVIHIPPLCGEKSRWDNLYLKTSIIK
jgi:hypothetical protein